MKIFYGIQGTGNGHIARARVMAEEFKLVGIQPDFQFSGRPADKFFDMEVFNNFSVREGLTFEIEKGSVNYWRTVRNAKISQFIKDVTSLDLSEYDLVISDYEPITAWAAKLQNIPVIGIGHQYAFNYDIPKQGFNCISSQIMRQFAPVNIGVGLHWHHFNQPILPPIIDARYQSDCIDQDKIVVYLPFEDQNNVIKLLSPFTEYTFCIYSPEPGISNYEHIKCYPLSKEKFRQNLITCNGVICNSGFELVSEALELGKKILVKPVAGQAEQISNALALTKLRYGSSMVDLNSNSIKQWLNQNHRVQISYPNVANRIVSRIVQNNNLLDTKFITSVWDDVIYD